MANGLRFLSQPDAQDSNLGTWLKSAMSDPEMTTLAIAVAWARFRGLVRVQPELEAFRARGGTSRLIVGIDEGGATRPGLLMAMRLFDRAHVFHEPSGGTFHPKIYLVEGARSALLVVGSSNATPGGWYNNYEASLEARFALPEETRDPALVGARQYVEDLLAETELCFDLTEELVDTMSRSRRYRVVGHERPRRRQTAGTLGGPEPADVDASGSEPEAEEGDLIFGSRRRRIAMAPALGTRAERLLKELEIAPDDEAEGDAAMAQPASDLPIEHLRSTAPVQPEAADGGPPTSASAVTTIERWSKVLPRGDAQQQASARTHETGNVRLTQAKHDIDWRTWFRQQLFDSPVQWRQGEDINGKLIERAQIPFDVTIKGVALGTVELEVTYAPHREAGQANHTTVLRWGPLQDTIRAADYTGCTLTLQRMSDASYRLDIS